MKQLGVYIIYNGNCEEALNFYASALGGEVGEINRYAEMPQPVADEHKNLVMHASYKNGDLVIMAADTTPEQPAVIGTNIQLSLDFDSDEKMEVAFNNLQAGGKVTMPLQDTFWGSRFGMVEDKYGVNWMFSHPKEQA